MKLVHVVTRCRTIALTFLFLSAGIARGEDLYTLTGTTTSGPPQTVTVTGSNFVDLVQTASTSSGAFQPLKGQDATYTITYAGQPAVILTRNAAGTSATLTIPSTGTSKTFNAANADELRKQVSDYVRQNTDDAMAKLNKKLAERSKVSFVDGNPHGVTSMLADDAFYRFALPRQDVTSNAGWWIKGDGGAYNASGFSGIYGSLGFGFDAPIGDRAALSIGLNNQYNSLEHSTSFSFLGLDVGLPITLVKTPFLDGLVWKVTPFGGGAITLSPDTVSGGGIYTVGAASSLSYLTGPWTFTLGDQISYFGGVNLGVEGRVYGNSELEQWITKNGIDVTYRPEQHFFVDTGLTYTHFFNNAGVPDYLSPTVGLGWYFSSASRIRVGARGDLANGYTSVGGEVSLTISY